MPADGRPVSVSGRWTSQLSTGIEATCWLQMVEETWRLDVRRSGRWSEQLSCGGRLVDSGRFAQAEKFGSVPFPKTGDDDSDS